MRFAFCDLPDQDHEVDDEDDDRKTSAKPNIFPQTLEVAVWMRYSFIGLSWCPWSPLCPLRVDLSAWNIRSCWRSGVLWGRYLSEISGSSTGIAFQANPDCLFMLFALSPKDGKTS